MKIIFETKEEKDLFIHSLLCPHDLKLPVAHKCDISCEECWSRVIEYEVKTVENT